MNAFHTSKANQSLSKASTAANPSQCPFRFVLDTWHCVYSLEQMLSLCCISNKVIQQKTVHLTVDILNGDLKAVKCPCFRKLDICRNIVQLLEHEKQGVFKGKFATSLPCMNLTARFSRTMPSDAAKNASTCVMKCFSSPATTLTTVTSGHYKSAGFLQHQVIKCDDDQYMQHRSTC